MTSDIDEATYPFTDKTPADFQKDVTVKNGTISGTLYFMEGGLSPAGELAGDGYFVALKWANPAMGITSLKVGLQPSLTGMDLVECIDDTDRNGVFKITPSLNQQFVVRVADDNGKVTYKRYDLNFTYEETEA